MPVRGRAVDDRAFRTGRGSGLRVERLSALTRIVTVMPDADADADEVSSSGADGSTGAAGAPGRGAVGGVMQGLTASDPLVVGGYTVLGRWGRSGWGREYLAQSAAGVLVTVRMIDPRWLGDPVVRSGLVGVMRAAHRTAGLSCVARILQVQVDGEVPHVVTEFVEGPSLRQVVAHHGAQVGDGLEWIAVQTLVALSALHDVGVVHRGLTPDCVVIGADGRRWVDGGLGRWGVSGGAAMDRRDDSWLYTAPEVVRGQAGDAVADLFAWAATITFAATGGPPFDMARVQDGLRGLDAADFDALGERALGLDIASRTESSIPAVARHALDEINVSGGQEIDVNVVPQIKRRAHQRDLALKPIRDQIG